jgi:hypothetical protein
MRLVAGCLLVCAAMLKAAEFWTRPTATMLGPSGHWLLLLQTALELGFGLIMISGRYWRTFRWLAILLFTSFASYSLYLVIRGADSCGCFGAIRIHPSWTFILDLAVVLGLVMSLRCSGEQQWVTPNQRMPRHSALRQVIVAAAMGAAVVAAAVLLRTANRVTAVAENLMPAVGNLVVLDPEGWIGKALPIARLIDIDVSKGKWIMLIHRTDCPACQEALPRYQQLALKGEHVALIEVPPYSHSPPMETTCYYGRLKDDRDWFVQTPVEVQLQDGIVTAVRGNRD